MTFEGLRIKTDTFRKIQWFLIEYLNPNSTMNSVVVKTI